MSDHIGGVAILDRRDPRREHISCFGFRDNKHPTYINIPVVPKGTPHTVEPVWDYEIKGNLLCVSPSVRQLAGNGGPEIFHNTGYWEVAFKDAVSDPYEELKAANPGCSQFD